MNTKVKLVVAISGALGVVWLTALQLQAHQTARLIEANTRALEALAQTRQMAAPSAPVLLPTTVRRQSGEDLAELRALLRQELQRLPQARAERHEVQAEALGPFKPNDQEPFVRAQQTVERAIAAGVWTDQDRMELNSALPGLSGEQVQSVATRLVTKMNDDTLKVTTAGPPFF
jgi:hypothetical protein